VEAPDLLVDLTYLPDGWTLRPLREGLRSIKNGTTATQELAPPGHPVSRIETLTDAGLNPRRVRYIRHLDMEELAKFELQPGDILLSHINSEPQLGRTAVYDGDPPGLVHGMNLLCLRVDPQALDPYYLHFLLAWYRRSGAFIRLAGRAVGQSSVNQGKLGGMVVPYPPLVEQRAIANVLRTVQQAMEATKQVIGASESVRRGVRRHLMTYGPVPVDQTTLVPLREWVGLGGTVMRCPSAWDRATLGGLTEKSRPICYGVLKPGPFAPDGVAMIRIQDLGSSRVSQRNLHFISPNLDHEYTRSKLRGGEVLISIQGTIGLVAVCPDELAGANISRTIAVIDPDNRVDNRFLFHYLRHLTDLGQYEAEGSTRRSLNIGTIREIVVPIPPANEQSLIAAALDLLDAKVRVEEGHRDALGSLAATAMGDLMSARRRVAA